MTEMMQAALPLPWNRSGAATRYPSPASQSAWFRRSWFIPRASWMTTTPDHGPSLDGVDTYSGSCPLGILIIEPGTHTASQGRRLKEKADDPLRSEEHTSE